MRILIVGCGYVGLEFAKRVQQQTNPDEVFALTRSEQRGEELIRAGIRPIVGHWLNFKFELPRMDAVLVAVPHREEEDLGEETHSRGLQQLISRLPAGFGKLIYLSTTGVYGSEAALVDEDSPVGPSRMGGRIALAGEAWLEDHLPLPQRLVIRLAGIYGPGRIPLGELIRTGQPLAVPHKGWINLVHVADIAGMLDCVCHHSPDRSLYVFSDGTPVQREVFYETLAKLAGFPPPRFTPPETESKRSQRSGSKRVDPRRLIDELSFTFLYPTYREGLQNCLAR